MMRTEQIHKRLFLNGALEAFRRSMLTGDLGGESVSRLTAAIRRMWTDPVLDMNTLTDAQVDELYDLAHEVITESDVA